MHSALETGQLPMGPFRSAEDLKSGLPDVSISFALGRGLQCQSNNTVTSTPKSNTA